MTVQSFYPIFEHGQVLTSSQLNDLSDYLEQQDRLSRRTLTGIGIVCGFGVARQGQGLTISGGVAVTSEGFLIAEQTQSYDRIRPYTLPVPTAEEASAGEIAQAQYPFFFDDDGDQIAVMELIDTDFAAAPGEDAPRGLTNADLTDAVVMLFLEAERAALKSCDVNDCSDKGAERRFARRRLLLTRDQAEAILAEEAEIAGRPVDLGRHPRLELPYLRVEKLAIAREGVDNYGALLARIMTIARKLVDQLPDALRDAWAAYRHIPADIFEDGTDPFPDDYFANVWGQVAGNVFLAQYLYDYLRDVAMAYNEFAEAAMALDAECQPNPDRFPRHVLLGDVGASVTAGTTGLLSTAGLTIRPAPRRTSFVPSPAHRGTALDDVRALFIRMHLLASTFDLSGRMTAPIRVTPSRSGAAPLSERAIPFHYTFDRGAPLFRNWSPRKTHANLLNTVYSHALNPPDAAHPLAFRVDDQDFYRVEGIVGKPLGTAMATLIAWKRDLGLSFGIEPVYIPLSTGLNDPDGREIDAASLGTLADVLRKLLLCRMSDFDALFMALLRALFSVLVFILRQVADAVARLEVASDDDGDGRSPTRVGDQGGLTTATLVGAIGNRGDLLLNTDLGALLVEDVRLPSGLKTDFFVSLPPAQQEQLKLDAVRIQDELRGKKLGRGAALKHAVPESVAGSIGAVYDAVHDDAGGGNLFDRTQNFVTERGGGQAEVQAVYAQVAMIDQGDQLMRVLNVDRVADFDAQAFDTAYRGFAGAARNYARTVALMPDRAGTTPKASAQVVAAADTIASESTAFAVSNLQDEIGRVVRRLLDGLTLDGFAERHPGLEHSAGVPKGGTLVLAYTGRAELERHLGQVAGRFRPQSDAVAGILGAPAALDLDGARNTLAAAQAVRTGEPLDDFVVLADFCLPFRCCDSDCSDIELSREIVADPFGGGFSPSPMAVPPVTEPGPRPRPFRGGIGLDGPVVTRSGSRTPPILGVVSDFVRPARVDEVLAARRSAALRHITAPAGGDGLSREPVATLTGRVVSGTGRAETAVPGATVEVDIEDRETLTATADRRAGFSMGVPAGTVRIRAVYRDRRSRRRSVTLEPAEAREIVLRLPEG